MLPGLAVALMMSGCVTPQPPDGPKIVIDGEKHEVLEPQVGSHIKRRIRIIDVKEPGISPTRTDIVTAETDTMLLPATASEMQRTITGGLGR